MSAASPDSFAITYDATQHLLVGRWLHNTSGNELYPSYGRLLATAKAHGN